MKSEDFNCSITANITAHEALSAICRVSEWWAKNFEGSSQKLNDVFTIRFGETWVTFKITEFMPDTKIVWTVTDSYLPWLNDKTEWTSTEVIFEIAIENNLTGISFTHRGLVPQIECYDRCSKGWTTYVPGSLLKLLTTGKGEPF